MPPLSADACDALFRDEAPAIGRALAARHRDQADLVDDALQHAFLRLRAQDPAPDNPAAWVTRVAGNWLLDERRRGERLLVDATIAAEAAPMVGPPTLTTTTTGSLTRRTVLEALAELPEQERELLRLKYLEGSDYAAIADRLRLNQKSLGTMLHRARAKLRALAEARLLARLHQR